MYWSPFVFEYVHANSSVTVYIRVVHFGHESDKGEFEGVVFCELDC